MFSLETLHLAFSGECWVCCHNLQGGRISSERFVGNHARCRSCACSKRDRKGKKVWYRRKFLCDFMGWVPGRLQTDVLPLRSLVVWAGMSTFVCVRCADDFCSWWRQIQVWRVLDTCEGQRASSVLIGIGSSSVLIGT